MTAMTFFLANGMEQARSLSEKMFGVNPDKRLAQMSNFLLYFTVFVDSICNDLCAHWMMNTVSERTLRQAQNVVEDRAERAARELMQHDVAMQAMQAGPTSLERAMELMQREKQVRTEVPAHYLQSARVVWRGRNFRIEELSILISLGFFLLTSH